MTAPRQILPESNYMLTRRCTQREFLLRPDPLTTKIILYCLAEAAARFDIVLIAWCFMANHWHGIVYDPHGVLPEFLERFHRHVARALNARWGRRENLWASTPTSVVHLIEPGDVVDKVIYTLANPVAADLVDHAGDWPGASSLSRMSGRPLKVQRPEIFFREAGSMPEEVTLVARPPRDWKRDTESWAEHVYTALRKVENNARERRSKSRLRVLGREDVLRTSPLTRPTTPAPPRKLRPSIACSNVARRKDAVEALRNFRLAYRSARERLVARDRSVVFPAGTYLLYRTGIVFRAVHRPAAPS